MPVKINGVRTITLIDSGCHHNLISFQTAKKLKIKLKPENLQNGPFLFAANGSSMNIIASADVIIAIATLKLPTTVLVVKNLNESIILGRAFLHETSAVLNFGDQTITFSDVIQVPFHLRNSDVNFIRVKESFCIPSETEILFHAECSPKFNQSDVLISPIKDKQFRTYATANVCSTVKNGQVLCRLFNVTNKALVLCKNQKVGIIQKFHPNMGCNAISESPKTVVDESRETIPETEEELERFAEEYKFNVGAEIDKETRLKLLRLLYKRRQAFASSIKDLKKYNKGDFDIQLTDQKPVFTRQYRLTPEQNKVVQEHIDDWVQNGILEPSTDYRYNISYFLVKKHSHHSTKW